MLAKRSQRLEFFVDCALPDADLSRPGDFRLVIVRPFIVRLLGSRPGVPQPSQQRMDTSRRPRWVP